LLRCAPSPPKRSSCFALAGEGRGEGDSPQATRPVERPPHPPLRGGLSREGRGGPRPARRAWINAGPQASAYGRPPGPPLHNWQLGSDKHRSAFQRDHDGRGDLASRHTQHQGFSIRRSRRSRALLALTGMGGSDRPSPNTITHAPAPFPSAMPAAARSARMPSWGWPVPATATAAPSHS